MDQATRRPERSETITCGNQGCCCPLSTKDAAARSERRRFCSEECARGRGCEHAGCACGALCDI
ncbi:MAG TPA: hypothetical protein VKZ63_20085 [Kofleriaceae bacterium]|nr:hypothetical protein [Kofleriaceae bacterium]